MLKLSLSLYLTVFFLNTSAQAHMWDKQIVSLKDGKTTTATPFAYQIQPGTVVIMSESHDSKADHDNQKKLIRELQRFNKKVSVAMEFFDYTKQKIVDLYLNKEIQESDFLKQIKWGKLSFDFYREQVLAPKLSGGKTYAINIPSNITSKISMSGLNSLTPSELYMLPPDFDIGNYGYKKRFMEYLKIVHGEVPPEIVENFWQAQCVWDDTMAWKISQAMEANPQQILVVHVGQFHGEYFGGLPDRLQVRGVDHQIVVTQYNTQNKTLGDLLNYIKPDPVYGPVADFVWVNGEPKIQ